MLKALIKSLENIPLNPWTLFSKQFGEEPYFETGNTQEHDGPRGGEQRTGGSA